MKVVVYSKANCPACVKVKSQFSSNGIEFEEVRVDQVPEARQMLVDNGHRSVPVVYADGVLVTNINDFINGIV